MRRVLAIACLILVGGGAYALATGASNDNSSPSYWVEVDNAFGLTQGSDLKVAGVQAGKISKLDVDRKTHKALVGIKLTKATATPFRVDTHCETRPESLIGEYFIDCDPGHAKQRLKPGATIPVTQTTSTIPPDLVANIMRLPYRERLRIIVGELGAGLAGRGGDLNAALRRAVPALRNTDRVLAILSRQRHTIQDLTHNSNTVIRALAGNRRDVARFVVTANRTAVTTAQRKVALAQTLHKLPAFLAQLTPAMRDLGLVAERQTPALRDLSTAAPFLTRFANDLGPFANATVPAVRSLGRASVTGRQAVRAARPTVDLLRRFTRPTPELAKNLRIILRHLDDRKFAAEADPRAAQQQGVPYRPGVNGTGYSGLEALLQYPFDQSLAVNEFDANSHILRLSLIIDGCSFFKDAQQFKAQEPQLRNNPMDGSSCPSPLGPNQPGINAPDPSTKVGPARSGKSARAATRPSTPRSAKRGSAPRTAPKPAPTGGLGGALGGVLGKLSQPTPRRNAAPRATTPTTPTTTPGGASSGRSQGDLLGYLLGP